VKSGKSKAHHQKGGRIMKHLTTASVTGVLTVLGVAFPAAAEAAVCYYDWVFNGWTYVYRYICF
jgi:hypothetical protein